MVFFVLAGLEMLLSTSLPMGSLSNPFTSGVDAEVRLASGHPFVSMEITSYTNSTLSMRFLSLGAGLRLSGDWYAIGLGINGVLAQRWCHGGYERLFLPIGVVLFEPGWSFNEKRVFLTLKIKEVFNETYTPDIVDIGIGIGM